jgi:hypothetical protein
MTLEHPNPAYLSPSLNLVVSQPPFQISAGDCLFAAPVLFLQNGGRNNPQNLRFSGTVVSQHTY